MLGFAYPIREDVASLRIDNEAGSLAGERGIGIKGTCLAEVDRNHVFDHPLNHSLPLGGILLARDMLQFGHGFDVATSSIGAVSRSVRRCAVVWLLSRFSSPILFRLFHGPVASGDAGCLLSFGTSFRLAIHDSKGRA